MDNATRETLTTLQPYQIIACRETVARFLKNRSKSELAIQIALADRHSFITNENRLEATKFVLQAMVNDSVVTANGDFYKLIHYHPIF